MPSIRYISNYYRMTKGEDPMKARPNYSSLQKNGCSRNGCSRPRAAASSGEEELCTAALACSQQCCWRAEDPSTGSSGGHKTVESSGS